MNKNEIIRNNPSKISVSKHIKIFKKAIKVHGGILVELANSVNKLNVIMTQAICLAQLLIDKGIITNDELDQQRKKMLKESLAKKQSQESPSQESPSQESPSQESPSQESPSQESIS